MEDSDNESGGHNSGGGGAGNGDFSSPREQDLLLPIANVSRIMKRALPANAKISKDAKETVQECVSEYISFITGEASDKCQREKRKTVNSEDLLWAMASLGFEDYVEPLKLYLQKFRELEGDKGSTAAAASQSQHREGSENEGFSGGDMMMRQKLFGTSPSPAYHPHTAGGGGNSSSSSGIGRHDTRL